MCIWAMRYQRDFPGPDSSENMQRNGTASGLKECWKQDQDHILADPVTS